ncbi:MAG: J domain-containing protein [Vampirovibrionales bacterium]
MPGVSMGGPPGDLYVMVHVEPHPQFQRDGYDVHSRRTVSYSDLALGARVSVEGLHGTETLDIPAGTQVGEVFTLTKKGAGAQSGQPARQPPAHIMVEIPKKLDKEEKQLLEQLQQLEKNRQSHESMANKHVQTTFKAMAQWVQTLGRCRPACVVAASLAKRPLLVATAVALPNPDIIIININMKLRTILSVD